MNIALLKYNKCKLLLYLLLCFNKEIISQGAPANPSIITGADTTICTGGCVSLTSTIVANYQTTSYTVGAIPYVPYPFTGAPILNGQDDLWSAVIPIGFNFCYFGKSYNNIVISANGELTFDLTRAGQFCNYQITASLPNIVDLPVNTICAAFRDIDVSLGGNIHYQTVGVSPYRTLVVSWVDIPLYPEPVANPNCVGTPHSTFQLVLYESTNYIDIYIENSFSCLASNNGYGIVGIQNTAGNLAICPPNRNFPNTWTANNEAWRFSPTGAQSYSVTWSSPGGIIGIGTTPITICPTTTTTYSATLVLTNCDGSKITETDDITVNVVPRATLVVNSPAICEGSSTVLTISGGTLYSWSPSGTLSSSTGSIVTASPTTTTIYTITETSGSSGCIPVNQATVTVDPLPSVSVNSPTAICAGGYTTLFASGAATYSWSPSTGLSSTSAASVIANPPATTVYTITGYSGSCPPSVKIVTLTVIPIASITVNSETICPGSSAVLTATGATTYSWSNGSTSNSITVSPTVTTTYSVAQAIGCSITALATVVVNNTLIASVNSPTICPGAIATLTIVGGTSYTWSTGSTSNPYTVTPNTTTLYTATVTDSSGCTGTISSVVNVDAIPVLSITNPNAVCMPITIDITTSSITAGSTGGGVLSYWTDAVATVSLTSPASISSAGTYYIKTTTAGGCIDIKPVTVSFNPTPNITVNSATICSSGAATLTAMGSTSYTWSSGLSAGTGSIVTVTPASTAIYTVTGSNGICLGSATSTVLVAPLVVINVASASICIGSSTTFTANGATSYTWLPMNTTGITANVSPTVSTTYSVIGVTGSCTGSTTVNAIVNSIPSLSVTNIMVCARTPTILTALGATSYTWNTGSTSTTIVVTPTVNPTTYTVTGSVNGCTNIAVSTLSVMPTPTLIVKQDTLIVKGTSVPLNVIGNGANYTWSPSFGLSCTNCTNPIASPTVHTQYCVTSAIGSCPTSTCVTIEVEVVCYTNTEYGTPNTFTPNGDGINDEFCLKGWRDCTVKFYVAIYDQWGEKVFESTDPDFCWDGKYKNAMLNTAVFIYYINAEILKVGVITRKGNISLIR